MSQRTYTPDEGPVAGEPAVGGLVLGEPIGEGAAGEVYAAGDAALHRTVAVKVLRSTLPAARARFVGEAQVTAQLEHPNIVPVHALGTLPDGRPYLAVPLELGRVVERAMAGDPRRRYASAGALREDLDAFLAHRPLPGVGSGPLDRLRKWGTRNRGAVVTAAGMSALGFAGLAGVAAAYVSNVGEARDAAVDEATRARAAQADAMMSLARAQVALSDAEFGAGHYGAARGHLGAARATLLAAGGDTREVSLAQSLLDQVSPPARATCKPHGDSGVLAVTPDGDAFASIGADGRWVRWRPDDCAVLAEARVPTPVRASLAGRYGLVVSGEEVVHLVGGVVVARQPAAPDTWVSVHASGFALLAGMTDRLVRVGDPAVVRETPSRGALPSAVVDGKWVLARARVGRWPGSLWDARGVRRWAREQADVLAVPDGGGIVVYGGDSGLQGERLDGRPGWATAEAPPRLAGSSGPFVWSLGFGDLLDIVDAGIVVRRLVVSPTASAVALAPDGGRLAVVASDGVSTWDLQGVGRVLLEGSGQSAALAVRGDDVYLGVEDAVVHLQTRGRRAAEVERWVGLGDTVRSVAVSADGRGLVVAAREGGVHMLVAGSAAPLWSTSLGSRALHAEWVDDTVVAVDAVGRVHRLDGDGGELGAVQVQPGASWDVSPVPGQRWVVVAGNTAMDSDVRVIDPVDGGVKATLPPRNTRYHTDVSPGGELVAVATHDGSVTLWGWASGTTRVLSTDAGPTLAVAFSPDGTLLATGGYDQRVRIWDVRSGALLRAVEVPGPVVMLAFAEGRLYATSGAFTLSVLQLDGAGR